MSVKALQDNSVWTGAQMRDNPRRIKQFPAAVLQGIDNAVRAVADVPWRRITRENFPLPGAGPYFDDVREELENGSGMVKMRGLGDAAVPGA